MRNTLRQTLSYPLMSPLSETHNPQPNPQGIYPAGFSERDASTESEQAATKAGISCLATLAEAFPTVMAEVLPEVVSELLPAAMATETTDTRKSNRLRDLLSESIHLPAKPPPAATDRLKVADVAHKV